MKSGGVIAVGDSITAHCSPDLVFEGVPPRSWAEWVALALGERINVFAKPGADSSEILSLLPRELPHARLGLVFAGVNNTLSWRRFRTVDLESTLGFLLKRVGDACDHVVVVQIPERLGMGAGFFPYGPGLKHRVSTNRAAVARVTAAAGAILVEGPKFTGNELWLDKVHPTSPGHLALADSVLASIGARQRASDLAREDAPTRPDMLWWRRFAAVRFAVRQPPIGFAGWLLGR